MQFELNGSPGSAVAKKMDEDCVYESILYYTIKNLHLQWSAFSFRSLKVVQCSCIEVHQ